MTFKDNLTDDERKKIESAMSWCYKHESDLMENDGLLFELRGARNMIQVLARLVKHIADERQILAENNDELESTVNSKQTRINRLLEEKSALSQKCDAIEFEKDKIIATLEQTIREYTHE